MKYPNCHTSGLTVDDAVLIFSFSNPHPQEDPIVQEVSDYVREGSIIWERLYLGVRRERIGDGRCHDLWEGNFCLSGGLCYKEE